ncbi:mechanosensitive ion channel family protein [Phaeobacter sp. PT47_59]|uniref:mechanosensitive ion channel family protein n=1 Tax=Phaeobacter sp. PT47_59 TaxID=3029979 RepID=UPI00238059FF|nr:mechanosensitive ion channel family protein [Phaeobacter sp. PT47_59]MDE4173131.1 mechanosensitive ion channel family protein [Phaeobacter sp. PT47_59]
MIFGVFRRSAQVIAAFLFLVVLLVSVAGPVRAQVSLYGQLEGEAEAQSVPDGEGDAQADPFARAIELAAEKGVGVIIVDGTGARLGGGASGEEAAGTPDKMEGASMLMKAQSEMDIFRDELRSRLEALPYSVFEMKYILRQTSPDGRIMTYVELLFWSLLFLFFGRWVTVEIYGKRFALKHVVARTKDQPEGYLEKMPFLVFRFLLGVGGTIFTMAVALFGSYLIFGASEDASVRLTVLAIYTAFFLSRTVSDLWRMVLSPYLSQYRIPVFSDRDAKRLYLWASILATYDISSLVFASWVGDFGLTYNVYAVVYGGLALIGLMGNLALVAFNARAITGAIRAGCPPEDCSWLLRVLSVAWAPAVVAYIVFGWLELAFDLVLERDMSIPLMMGTYLALTSILVVYGVINYGIEAYAGRRRLPQREAGEDEPEPGEGEEAAAAPARRRHPIASFEDLARRVAGILAFVMGAVALFYVWNPDLDWIEDSAIDRLYDVVVILFIGYIVYNAARIWIDGKIDEEVGDLPEAELGDEGGAGGASRLATLLPLFRGAILAVVLVSIILIVLLELGINVSPLFAGAGVVGLAVGFGSQALVRDIFSGAFFLVDDAFRKGEYIDIGDVKGTVEKISVRSFQLRHHLGALHTIPFGEIRVLTNYSRDWVMMKLPLRVTYDTDVEKVRKLIKKLGQELLSDPVIGDNFIQPLKSQGVIEMQDSAMIIRVKFMTKPGDQWLVRKKVYEEIRQLFEREGIKFAHREVTVRLAEDQSDAMTPQKKEALAGAVQAAIDEDLLDVNEGGGDR